MGGKDLKVLKKLMCVKRMVLDLFFPQAYITLLDGLSILD